MAFVVGDWLVYGEERFGDTPGGAKLRRITGDRYDLATNITGIDRAVLKIYAHVSRRVPRAARCAMLSWEHHKAVARLAPTDQQHWLAIASRPRIRFLPAACGPPSSKAALSPSKKCRCHLPSRASQTTSPTSIA